MRQDVKDAIRSFCLVISCLLHLIWIFLFTLVLGYGSVEYNPLIVSLAAVNVLLTVLTIVLGLGALFGYWQIRDAATALARRQAERVADESARRVVSELAWTVTPADESSQAFRDALGGNGDDDGDDHGHR